MAIRLQASTHAEQRIKERMGITNKREIKELVKNVYHNGMSMKKHYIPKSTLWWIDRKVNQSYFGRCSNWRIHNNYLFLYSKTLTLVTVIEIPRNLVPRKSKEELVRW